MQQHAMPTLGEMCDSYYEARAKRLAAQKEVDSLKDQEAVAEQLLLNYLKAQGLEGAKGSLAVAAIKRNDTLIIDDNGVEGSGKTEFLNFVAESQDPTLLQFRPSLTRVKELMEEGIEVPGAKIVKVESISLTKVSKK